MAFLLVILAVGSVQAHKIENVSKPSVASMGKLRSPGIEQQCKSAECDEKVRKFKVSKFLHGIAKTCEEVGNALNAQTHKDKQQAACNIVSSLLSVAANAAQDKEEGRDEQVIRANNEGDGENRSAEIGCEHCGVGCVCEPGACACTPDNCCLRDQALFRKICLMESDDQEKAIELAFRSGFFSREFLWDLFASIKDTFTENSRVILEFIKEKMDYLADRNQEIKLSRDRGDEEWDEDEEVADEVLVLLAAFWNFALEVSHEQDAEIYLKRQFSALMDFVYKRIFGMSPPVSHDTTIEPEEEQNDDETKDGSQRAPSEEPTNVA